jgi:hypothetical protein
MEVGESLETLSAVESQSWVSFSSYRFSLAHKTPFYDTKMLLKIVFDETAFVKFYISNNFKKTIPSGMDLKI